jgi:hypothetical protein
VIVHKLFTGIAVVAALAAPLRAQTETTTGAAVTSDPLQVMGQGARPLAMGSAFTAVKGDLMAALFNPAGQAYLRGASAAIHHHSWLGGINQDSLAAVVAGPALSVGLYGDLVNYGEIQGFDATGAPTGGFTPTDFTLGLAVAHQFGNGLAIGAAGRGTQQSFAESGQLLSHGDIGLMWSAAHTPLTLGLAYANLGPPVNGRASTTALRLGMSYDAELTDRSGVLFALGGAGLNNGASVIQTGVEGRLGRNFFLRLGYQLSFMDSDTGGLTGLSSGLGAKVGPLVLDYAYLPYGRIGNSHRLSLSFQFDNGAPEAPKLTPPTVVAPAAPKPQPAAASPPAPASVPAAAIPPVQTAPAPVAAAQAKSGDVDMVFDIASSPEEQLLQATKDRPGDAMAWKALGRYYYGKRDKARMLEAYRKAVALDPDDQALKSWLQKVDR